MIAFLLAIFSGIAFVIKFIKSLLIKYVGFAAILTFQFAVTASLITFVLAFYAFTITALIGVYNQAYAIPTYLSNFVGVDCFLGLLHVVGFAPALQNGFNAFFAVLSTILIFNLFKFTLHTMRLIGTELFKLGVLLGQALS
jgi:hypothetical protein